MLSLKSMSWSRQSIMNYLKISSHSNTVLPLQLYQVTIDTGLVTVFKVEKIFKK